MREIYTEMLEALKRGESFAIATVVATQGATPRKAGAKMLLFPGGRTVGTIGGGYGEDDISREALAIIGGSTSKLVTVDLNADVEAEDMICGGTMEILIEPMGAGV